MKRHPRTELVSWFEFALALVVALAVAGPVPVLGAALDPMRPQSDRSALLPLGRPRTLGFELSGLLHGSRQSIAIVNGLPQRDGDRVGRYRIERIDQHCVSYFDGARRQRACLRPSPSVLSPAVARPVVGRIE